MGKLVPKRTFPASSILSFEADVQKLIDKFVLKVRYWRLAQFGYLLAYEGFGARQVQGNEPISLLTFKEIWRSDAFSFIHQVRFPSRHIRPTSHLTVLAA